jgi:hypothetical protein
MPPIVAHGWRLYRDVERDQDAARRPKVPEHPLERAPRGRTIRQQHEARIHDEDCPEAPVDLERLHPLMVELRSQAALSSLPAADLEHLRRSVEPLDIETGLEVREERTSRPTPDLERRLSVRLDRLPEEPE